MNRNGVATLSHNEHKYVLLNNKCLKYSMNRTQSKDHKIGTYEIKKFHCLVLITKHTSKAMDMRN